MPTKTHGGPVPLQPTAQQAQVARLLPEGATLAAKRRNSHDHLVRSIFERPENAGPLLAFLLSGYRGTSMSRLDFSRATSFRLSMKNSEAGRRLPDLVFLVPVAGTDEYVLVHVEHQSRFFLNMAERMLEYFSAFAWSWALTRKGEPRPRLIQILLCHDTRDHQPWAGSARIVEGNGPVTGRGRWPGAHRSEFLVRDLEVISAGTLRDSPLLTPAPRAALALLKLAPAGRRGAAGGLPEWVFDQVREADSADPGQSEDVLLLAQLRYD